MPYPFMWISLTFCKNFFLEMFPSLPIHESFLPQKFPAIRYRHLPQAKKLTHHELTSKCD